MAPTSSLAVPVPFAAQDEGQTPREDLHTHLPTGLHGEGRGQQVGPWKRKSHCVATTGIHYHRR